MNEKDKIIAGAIVFILLLSTVIFAIQKSSDNDDDEGNILEEDHILDASMDYMLSPKVVVTASSLHTDLNDGVTNNDPFLLDIRGFEDYAAGHVPGSINIPFLSVFANESLEKLPVDEQIVVICYTGHTASQATALLNAAGFDAIALKWGFEGWSNDGKAFDPDSDAHEYEVVTGADPGVFTAGGTRCDDDDDDANDDDDPNPDPDPADDDDGNDVDGNLSGDVIDASHTYLQAGKPAATKANVLRDNLNDGDGTNDPFILDIRKAVDYEAGHIGGSVNIPFASVFTEENLSKLPKDTQIVVVCYTGHTASQITALLNINGFDAIALKWGFESWGDGGKAFDPDTRPDYAVEVWYDVRAEADTFMAEGNAPAMSAANLRANMDDGNATNNPFILDIRSGADYETTHIPTSVNVGFRSVFTTENLSKLPTDTQIVVVCYTGHTASQITALLGVSGYDAIALKWGWSGWNANDTKVYNHTTITAHPEEAGASPAVTGDAEAIYETSITEAANDYLGMGKSPAMSGDAVNDTLGGMDEPFILDIRGSADYEAGHVPGAVNIPFRSVFTEENFSKLPSDAQIMVVCYSGHTASQTTALLNLAGLDAIALKWGYAGWIPKETYPGAIADDNPMVSGTEPGDWP